MVVDETRLLLRSSCECAVTCTGRGGGGGGGCCNGVFVDKATFTRGDDGDPSSTFCMSPLLEARSTCRSIGGGMGGGGGGGGGGTSSLTRRVFPPPERYKIRSSTDTDRVIGDEAFPKERHSKTTKATREETPCLDGRHCFERRTVDPTNCRPRRNRTFCRHSQDNVTFRPSFFAE